MHKSINPSGRTNIAVSHVEFDGRDAKGRQFGVQVVTDSIVLVPASDSDHSYWSKAPGTYLRACVQSTKNGECWGASQPYKWFDTEGDRAAWIEARVKRSRAAAAKKAGQA